MFRTPNGVRFFLSVFLYAEIFLRKIKNYGPCFSIQEKYISGKKKMEKGVKNARTDAAFSLYEKNDSSGTKNQSFLYLRSTFSCMEKKSN